jgi:hypothetical protein
MAQLINLIPHDTGQDYGKQPHHPDQPYSLIPVPGGRQAGRAGQQNARLKNKK